jgi:hypothetical protein
MDDQREVHGHRMEALVDQRLGEIERVDVVGKAAVGEDRLVHAGTALGERRVEHVLEASQDVVGVEHRVFGDLLQSVGAVAEDVGERAGEHAHLAVERGHASKRLRMRVGGIFFFDNSVAAVRHLRGER